MPVGNKILNSYGLQVARLKSTTSAEFGTSITFTLGSDAQGDMFYRGASGSLVKLSVGSSTTYLKGGTNPSWATLDTTAVTENGNLYFTTARVLATTLTGYSVGANTAIDASDTILGAFQKIQGQINAGGGGVSFANPTASIGLTAVNGSASTAMRSDAAPALSQSIAPSWTGFHTHLRDSIGTTITTAITLSNTTAAAAGAQQMSPAIEWSGFGWKTNTTASSQPAKFRAFMLPVEWTFNTKAELVFQGAANATGSYTDALTIGMSNSTPYLRWKDGAVTGNGGIALAPGSVVSGQNAAAIGGQNAVVSGQGAISIGTDGEASGNYSLVANDATVSHGTNASTFGFGGVTWSTHGFNAGLNNYNGHTDSEGGTANQYVTNVTLGSGIQTTGHNAIGIGYQVKVSTADKAIAIGSGFSSSLMTNSVANSLAIGFNSDVPTVHIRPGSGTGTYGQTDINGALKLITVAQDDAENKVLVVDATDNLVKWRDASTLGGGGGMTNPMTTLGDIIYGGASGAATRLGGNTSSTGQFLKSTGSTGAATAPVWAALAAGDIPDIGASYIKNTTTSQTASFSVSGTGTVGNSNDLSSWNPKFGVSKYTTGQSSGMQVSIANYNTSNAQSGGSNYANYNFHYVTGGAVSGAQSSALINILRLESSQYSYSTSNMWAATISQVTVNNNSTADKIANLRVYTEVFNSSNISELRMLYIETPLFSGGTNSITTRYAIFQEDALSDNLFYGRSIFAGSQGTTAVGVQLNGGAGYELLFNGTDSMSLYSNASNPSTSLFINTAGQAISLGNSDGGAVFVVSGNNLVKSTVAVQAESYVDIKEISTPANPTNAGGFGRLYVSSSDGKIHFISDAGVDYDLTATGGGGVSDGDKGDITVASSGASWTIDTNAVTLAKMAQVSTSTFLGRVSASTGNVESLTGTQATTLLDVFTTSLKGLAPASGGGTTNFLRADGTWAAPSGGIADGDKGDVTVSASGATWTIDANAVTLAKMAQVASATFLGRVTASTGNVEALTGTQATTLLDTFTSTLKGLAPASGGGTTNFLRADGTWAAPSGGSGTPPFSQSFNATTDWGAASGGYYTLAFTHNLGTANIQVELWDETSTAKMVFVGDVIQTSSNVLSIKVPQTPDNRFAGRVVISTGAGGSGGGSSFPTQQSHTSGSTVTISNVSTADIWLLVNPSSTLSSLTVTMPSTAQDGQTATLSFGGTMTSGTVVTSLTISPNSGQTILQGTTPGSVIVGESIAYRYKSSNSTWYRIF